MNWIRNKSWLVLTAMLLLASTLVLAGVRTAAQDPSFPAHAAPLSSVRQGHDEAGQAVDAHHDSASAGGAHAAGMMGGLPCNAACPVGASSCVPTPLTTHAGSLPKKDAGPVCIRNSDDVMLSGIDPDAQLKPPKPVA